MKKYSDWQKYVREQIDKMNTPGQERDKTAPQKPVQEFDKDKFVIHKKETVSVPPAPKPAPSATLQSPKPEPQPYKQLELTASRPEAKPPDSRPEPPAPPAKTVQINEAWKPAEKTRPTIRHTAPAYTKPAAPPQAPATKPEPPRPAKTQPPVSIDDFPSRPNREQTREEILERLINPTISLEEAAKILGVCKATVRRYTQMSILPHYRTPGNQRRFKLNDIILFLETQKKEG